MVSMDQFRETYLNECAELLSEMEERLVSLSSQSAEVDVLNAIFRCAHSIKGGAGAFGFERVTGFTHILESLLDALREGKVAVSDAAVSALLQSVDVVKSLLQLESTGTAVPADYGAELAATLKDLCGMPDAPQATTTKQGAGALSGSTRWRIQFTPNEDMFATGSEPLLLLRELRRMGKAEVAINIARMPALAELNPEKCYLGFDITLQTERSENDIREVFEFVEDNCMLAITRQEAEVEVVAPVVVSTASSAAAISVATPAAPEGASLATTSIRVDLEKIDRLVNMVGELVITQAMLFAQARHLPVDRYPELLRGVDDLAHHTRELQEAVMAVRMQPVKSIFSRMPRIVRDIAQQLGKDIRLIMQGEQTEVDKTIIEQLSDPLTHMIRNAADHGIEMPEVREAAGKPRQGTISLSAYHQGGHIMLEVTEDGAGLNRERILAKAKEKNLVASDAQLSDEAIEQLIFLPGFSTAEKLSNISGRGVGMDVVKRTIAGMGGHVHVKSTPGKGSCFTATLPLTLAILDGMIVRVGAEFYIIPITSIIETMRPRAGEVKVVPEGHDVLNVRGEFVPVMYLGQLFAIHGAELDAAKALVVLVESGGKRIGLVVDELVGQQQVVIKSLEDNADPVQGISGATILGDGKVSLILDIAGLEQVMAASARARQGRNTQHKELAYG